MEQDFTDTMNVMTHLLGEQYANQYDTTSLQRFIMYNIDQRWLVDRLNLVADQPDDQAVLMYHQDAFGCCGAETASEGLDLEKAAKLREILDQSQDLPPYLDNTSIQFMALVSQYNKNTIKTDASKLLEEVLCIREMDVNLDLTPVVDRYLYGMFCYV